MAIRWSKKAKRFYDDQTGYPVSKTRGFRSSIGRASYRKVHRKRRISKQPRHAQVKQPSRKSVRGYEAPEGYRVRPLSEEFAEELEQFDGTLDDDMDFDDYMDFLDEDDEAMDADDSYSED